MVRPTLVIDLDGTLVDSLPDLHASLNRLMLIRGLPPFAPREVAAFIGDGAAMLVERAMRNRQRAATPDDVNVFLADYTAHAAECSTLFPGVADTLAAAQTRGWRLAVCTNKPGAPARSLLAALHVADRFDAIGGGDSFPTKKPDPAHLLATIAAAGGSPAASVMVGDHRNDVLAAKGAAIPVIFADWGYGTADMAAGADAVASAFADLLPAAAALLRA
ncbi:MAG: phosphoglycolate phosphatase [Acetobacteraceae bacterium]|nr:phosphoglycolate phosphatase [Acetobacteraceae bacterium]